MLDRRSAIRQDTPNARIEDFPECFTRAALAKPTAFPPWLTFHQIVNDVRAIGGELMALFLFSRTF